MSKSIVEQAKTLLSNIELSTVLHEVDKEMDAEDLSEAQLEAIKTVAAYKRRMDDVERYFPLSELVYHFLGEDYYEDSFWMYKSAAVGLLAAMADTSFNNKLEEKLGDTKHRTLVRLLQRLLTFLEAVQERTIYPLLLIQDIKSHERSDDDLLQIREEYDERLRVSLAGKFKRT